MTATTWPVVQPLLGAWLVIYRLVIDTSLAHSPYKTQPKTSLRHHGHVFLCVSIFTGFPHNLDIWYLT